MSPKPEPVLVIMSTVAGAQALFAAMAIAAPADSVPSEVAKWGALVVAAITAGMGYYIRGQVVPMSDTGSFLNKDREMVAGPAAAVQDGKPVEVVPLPAQTDLL